MKKLFYIISATAVLLSFAACQEEVGSVPGSDGKPFVTSYQYAPPKGYNSDEDVQIRFVKNDKVESAKFLVELKSAKDTAIAHDGEKAYIKKVLEEGTAIEFVDGVCDTVLVGLANYYDITVVAVNGSKKAMSAITYAGLAWKPGVMGKYTFSGNSKVALVLPTYGGVDPVVDVEFQQCEFDDALYRFKDLYGAGKSLKIRLTGEDPVDDGRGPFVYFRVANGSSTGLSYSGMEIFTRDIGNAINDDYFYALGYDYECGLYEDGHCNLNLQYYCEAGAFGYAWDETFVPNATE